MAKVFTITEGLENMGALKTGGQGSVYKGRRIGPIITAVKLLPTPIHSESPHDKNYTDFQNEVHKLQKVNQEPNPNVVKILSSGLTESGSFPFIEMEFIEGPDLEELLKPPHPPVFTIKETIKVAEQLSNALAHCHKVDVKHGDIKSNNVKFSKHTGNYVLLDFGLAIMSDEQRRTSLRHAGAIEFMAPEQNEGIMLFQTDVYSFGVVLFELLAGQVPFPLSDKGETARNMVMVAHMETPPPNLLSLRRQNLPAAWSQEVKDREMRVPQWLVELIHKCLEKKPLNRFADGRELHDYIVLNSTLAEGKSESGLEQAALLQEQNGRLQREKEELQAQLAHYQQALAEAGNKRKPSPLPPGAEPPRKRGSGTLVRNLILAGLVLAGLVFLVSRIGGSREEGGDGTTGQPEQVKQRGVIGQYKVVAARAYFHNEADAATRRTAYMVPSNDVVAALDEKKGFIYTEFTNNKGQTSKGWLRKRDLVSLEEWNRNNQFQEEARLTAQDIKSQLKEARSLMNSNDIHGAVYIYSYLADQEVPEAMYEFSNLALQNKTGEIGCGDALVLLERAADAGYAPAKRTLGFLYLFAENREVLQVSNYDRCQYEKNVLKGTQLLLEAIAKGDTTAKRVMNEINNKRAAEPQEPDPGPIRTVPEPGEY